MYGRAKPPGRTTTLMMTRELRGSDETSKTTVLTSAVFRQLVKRRVPERAVPSMLLQFERFLHLQNAGIILDGRGVRWNGLGCAGTTSVGLSPTLRHPGKMTVQWVEQSLEAGELELKSWW